MCRSILLWLTILSFDLYAQQSAIDIPAVSSGDIQFYIDHSAFNGNAGKQYVEFYIMLFADQLELNENNKNKITAEFSVNTLLTDSYQNEISKKEWTTEALINGESDTKVIYDLWNEELNAGDYKLKIIIWESIPSGKNKTGGKKGEANYGFKINEISEEDFTSSQIEFASKIDSDIKNNHFQKGNKSVTPNPSRRFGVLNPILYIYYELYNIGSLSGKLEINYSIINSEAEKVKSFPPVEADKKASSLSLTHGLNVGNIPSGIYDLRIDVLDSVENKSLQISRRFEAIQKDYADLQPVLSFEDAEVFEKLLNIIGTPEQKNFFNGLQLNAKAEYIIQFWKQRDPVPGTPENEYLEIIQQRFLYANKNFSWGNNSGWETERGRVLIQHGMPDEIEQHHSEAASRPYEVWTYRQERSYVFIFGDLQSNGRFVLLHSNKEGEIYNDRWTEYLRQL